MKRKFAYASRMAIMAIVLVSCLSGYTQSVTDPTISMDLSWKIGSWLPIWRIERFHSRTLDQQVGYYLYLPPDYEANPNQRYPVIY